MKSLSARERRIVALGLLVLALALVWFAMIAPVIGGFRAREEERQELLTSYARGERVIGAMRATRAALRAQHAAAGDYAIAAPNAAQAADLLRERVLTLAHAAHVTVSSVQDAQAPPGMVAVRADVTLSTDALGPLIARLESEPPWLTVEQFGVTADRAAEIDRGAPIDVRLDLSARFDAPRAPR